MKLHAFSPRAAATAMGMAVLLAGAAATGASAAETSTPAVPGAPTGLAATPGDGTVTLSWFAPGSDGGSPVDGYVIEGGTSPAATSITERVGGTATAVSGLANGTTYYFRVNAHNSSGDGAAATVTVTPDGAGPRTEPVPSAPAGLRVSSGDGFAALSWSPPAGGLKASEGYLIYMGTSPGQEGAKPSVPHLIENATSYTVAPLKDGTRYYFQVALLDGTQVSARSAEVSAVPGAAAGPPPGASADPGPTPGASTPARSGVGKNAQPATSPRPATELAQHRASSSRPTVLIILLAALSLAATGAAIAIAAIQRRRRRHSRRYALVPAPRRPHDDQRSRVEQMNGPRYH